MQEQSKELNFNGERIYVGIDVHLKSWSVTILTENNHHKTFNQPPEAEKLATYLRTHFPDAGYYSAYEAGFSGLWTHYELESLGINNIVINPADVPTTGKEKMHKTDSVDSRKIARSLRSKELRCIHIPSQITLSDRSLIRMRISVVKDLSRLKQRIKMMLHFYGVKIPDSYANDTRISKRFVEWLRQDAANTGGINKEAFIFLINEFEAKKQSLLTITRMVSQLCKEERYKKNIELIRSIPGIGLITGITFLVEIEDITRFQSNDKFAGFIGIIPSCHSSGEKDNKGEMTPRGQINMKAALIESSWIAARVDPVLTLAFNKYCRRMESNKAITGIARKLANRIYFVLTKQTRYVCGVVQ
ncbi:MAG: IS110 family transposase [Tannerellaceae bacterium]|jgi:transposase|nr:IS110 family transposase [Tannerellaceae bacterium]